MGRAPDLGHMRVFGSRCWYVLPSVKTKKLDPRAGEAIMIGYSTCSKAYKLWDDELKKVIISRSVRFSELPDATMPIDSDDRSPAVSQSSTIEPLDTKEHISEKTSKPLSANPQSGESSTHEIHPTPPPRAPLVRSQNILRRSTRESRPPRRFGFTPSHSANIAFNDVVDSLQYCLQAVSYTHLTLPTKA